MSDCVAMDAEELGDLVLVVAATLLDPIHWVAARFRPFFRVAAHGALTRGDGTKYARRSLRRSLPGPRQRNGSRQMLLGRPLRRALGHERSDQGLIFGRVLPRHH